MYPGTNVSRNAAALELLALLLSSCASNPTTLAHPTYRRALAPLLSSATAVHSLLDLFLAPWERTRRQAFDLLGAFPPGPFPGLSAADGRYEGVWIALLALAYWIMYATHSLTHIHPYKHKTHKPHSVAPSAVHWAKQLTLSARRGEAEAGALMLRLLFQRAYLLSSPTTSGGLSLLDDDEEGENGVAVAGRVRFLMELRRLIKRRLDGFERGLEAWAAVGEEGQGGIVMVFGAIQAARFVLEASVATVESCGSEAAAWGREVEALLTLLERAMEVRGDFCVSPFVEINSNHVLY